MASRGRPVLGRAAPNHPSRRFWGRKPTDRDGRPIEGAQSRREGAQENTGEHRPSAALQRPAPPRLTWRSVGGGRAGVRGRKSRPRGEGRFQTPSIATARSPDASARSRQPAPDRSAGKRSSTAGRRARIDSAWKAPRKQTSTNFSAPPPGSARPRTTPSRGPAATRTEAAKEGLAAGRTIRTPCRTGRQPLRASVRRMAAPRARAQAVWARRSSHDGSAPQRSRRSNSPRRAAGAAATTAATASRLAGERGSCPGPAGMACRPFRRR